MLVRQFLFANGLRYKLHDKSFTNKPDIALNSKATNKQDFYFALPLLTPIARMVFEWS
jgi:hypothetical protein